MAYNFEYDLRRFACNIVCLDSVVSQWLDIKAYFPRKYFDYLNKR